jgi:hypothetical protein
MLKLLPDGLNRIDTGFKKYEMGKGSAHEP